MKEKFSLCKKDAFCLEKLKFSDLELKITEFTQDINLKGYVMCKHESGCVCTYGVQFGGKVMCKCSLILNIINQQNASRKNQNWFI